MLRHQLTQKAALLLPEGIKNKPRQLVTLYDLEAVEPLLMPMRAIARGF
jgi:hypothetical protein